MLWLGLLLITTLAQTKGFVFTIEPGKVQYTGKHDVTIRCSLEDTYLTSVEWIQIWKESAVMKKRPFVTLSLSYDTEPVWGSGFNREKLKRDISVRYEREPAGEAYMEMTFHEIVCEDEGIYTCEVRGTGNNDSVVEYQTREQLAVYSYGGRPSITYFGEKVPNQELMVSPGNDVVVRCHGMVGKPHLPVTWFRYNPHAGVFLEVQEGVGEETLMIHDDNLCSYEGSRYLTFKAPTKEPEVTYRCGIGPIYDVITVLTSDTEESGLFGRTGKITGSDTEHQDNGGLLLSINPSKIQYQDTYFDVTIKCSVGRSAENMTSFGLLQLLKESPVERKRPYLTLGLINGSDADWGSGQDRQRLEDKSTVTFKREPLDDAYLQVVLHKIECADDGIYTCLLYGADSQGDVIEEKVREELSIYSFAGEPVITVGGKLYPTKEIFVNPGVNLTLICSGPVGKPHLPIQWNKYNMMAGAYIYNHDGVVSGSLSLPTDDLCRYQGTSRLTFLTTSWEREVTYQCRIGPLVDSMTVVIGSASVSRPSYWLLLAVLVELGYISI